MTVAFSIEEQDNTSWRASDYFVDDRTIIGVLLGKQDL